MLRALLAALLLLSLAFAFAPAASATTLCTMLGPEETKVDQTWDAGCHPAGCLYETAPNAWTGCATSSAGKAVGYALCFGTTGPLFWVPDCT